MTSTDDIGTMCWKSWTLNSYITTIVKEKKEVVET